MCAISLQVPVPLVKNASLSVSMFDKLGRKFDNFSSIFVEWKSSDHSLGTVERVRDGDAEDLGQRNGYQRTFLPHDATALLGICDASSMLCCLQSLYCVKMAGH